jgi:galactose mutarotase-like enzyme
MQNKPSILEFKFSLAYRVEGNQLFVTYLVENTGDKNLYFSVGAHPAFRVPLTNGTGYEDWFLEFGTTETVGVHPLDAEGLVEPVAVPYLDNCCQLPLKKVFVLWNALVFKNLKAIALASRDINLHMVLPCTMEISLYGYLEPKRIV